MITKEQVEAFLDELHTKMKITDILFRDDRGKNQQTLVWVFRKDVKGREIYIKVKERC